MKNIRMLRSKWVFTAVLAATIAFAQIPPEVKPALDRITSNDLKGDVSFLASDLLQGRATPSPGLDVAGAFIASKFRAAGLDPAGDDGYFQTAHVQQVEADMSGFKVEISNGKETIALEPGDVGVRNTRPVDLAGVEAVKSSAADRKGKVVLTTMSELRRSEGEFEELQKSGAAMIIVSGSHRHHLGPRILVDESENAPVVFVRSDRVSGFLKNGEPAKVTAHIAAPKQNPVVVRNVAGILHGSDPTLRDTYVLVTAHYDHLGVKADGPGDRIYHGANDNASGTASIMEIASALSRLPVKPRRSIVFIAFFGEEEGMLGSKWYDRHPAVPLAKTIGDINLEQMGRTDDRSGKQVNTATLNGFDFSDLPQAFAKAGELTGIKVYKDEKRSDSFFDRSDNQALADSGIPAHTMAVAYEFPDYHDVGDEWQKLDYENMARVDRMVALGVWMLAQSDKVPCWNAANPETRPYVAAAARLHDSGATAATK
jgi:hypothetical protein